MARPARMHSIVDAVGQTPIVRLHRIGRDVPNAKLYLKLEYTNPGGSVKDRPALQMMKDAIADGRLTKNKVLIDATSGNTGVAYSIFGAALGYKIALVMPANVSQARKNITRAYGTELIFSDPMEGSDGAIRLVRDIVAKNPDKYFYPDQYSNPSNPLAHYLGTAGEILDALGDRITHFVKPARHLRGRGARRGPARSRGLEAHGLEHRARNLRPGPARRDPPDHHGRRLGHVGQGGGARRASHRPFHGREHRRRGEARRAPPRKG